MYYDSVLRGEVSKAGSSAYNFVGSTFLPDEFERLLLKASEKMKPGMVYEFEIRIGTRCLGAVREESSIPHRSEVSHDDFFDFDSELHAVSAKNNARKSIVTAGRLLKKEGADGEQE